MGYSDDESKLNKLKPLNFYGESKHKFDMWAESQGILDRVVGLKYFNIFGPNEYHKENMQSMAGKGFIQAMEKKRFIYSNHIKKNIRMADRREIFFI